MSPQWAQWSKLYFAVPFTESHQFKSQTEVELVTLTFHIKIRHKILCSYYKSLNFQTISLLKKQIAIELIRCVFLFTRQRLPFVISIILLVYICMKNLVRIYCCSVFFETNLIFWTTGHTRTVCALLKLQLQRKFIDIT